jgi:pimeloyl-ACP methyl ester carboxylesterase
MVVKRTVRATGGRRLSTQVSGDPDGRPVFLLHGTPGSRLGPHHRSAVLHRLGIRLISFDRPGYGGADRVEGRNVADAASDVLTIADARNCAGEPRFLDLAARTPRRERGPVQRPQQLG